MTTVQEAATRASDLDTGSVLAMLRGKPQIQEHAYVVGAWVWVEFPGRPDQDTREFLKASGFHWNQTRQVWQHSCGVRRHADRRGDPRFRYGMVKLGQGQVGEGDDEPAN